MKPLCELSLIVAVSSGPGIMAPEKAMIKDDTKIVISSHTVYIRPISKMIESLEQLPLSQFKDHQVNSQLFASSWHSFSFVFSLRRVARLAFASLFLLFSSSVFRISGGTGAGRPSLSRDTYVI